MQVRPTQALVRRAPRSYVDYYARRAKTVLAPLADLQHQNYVRALEGAGLGVSFVDADEELPDCVFIEDTAVVWNGHALITRMHQDRDGEQGAVENILRDTHCVTRLPKGAILEGGDVLHLDDVTYVGVSTRTNEAGAESLTEFLAQFGRSVVKVPVIHCLHLKTGITYLGDRTLLAVPKWFDVSNFEVDDVIYTEASERNSANCLRIGDRLLAPDGYPRTYSRLQQFAEKVGVEVDRISISEYEKGDGSLTCLSLIW